MMVENYSELTCTFLRRFLKDNKNENVFFSPFSILVLLALAADSAAGKTRSEITDVLSGGAPFEVYRTELMKLERSLASAGTFSSATAVCVKEAIRESIVRSFEENLARLYGGRLFASRDIVRDVNVWVEEQTRGMIKDIADESMSNMLACLMNAVAFESEWLEPYEEENIYEGEFTNADRTVSCVQMMKSEEDTFYEDELCTGFAKPYQDGDYTFWAWLPKRKGEAALRKLAEHLDFAQAVKTADFRTVRVTMPEFTQDFSADLTELFRAMGIRTLFTGAADFSPMSSEHLTVDGIIHKAHIEVDRKGTKAAAASIAIMVKGAMLTKPKSVCLDRPFIYAVMNNETGLPVFAGVCNQIRED